MVIPATRSAWASPTPALISRQVALELRLGPRREIEPGKLGCTSALGNPRQIARISEVTSQSQQKLASLMVCQAKHYSSWWEAVMPAQGSWWFGQKQWRPPSSQLQPKPTGYILQPMKTGSTIPKGCSCEKSSVHPHHILLMPSDSRRSLEIFLKTVAYIKLRLSPGIWLPVNNTLTRFGS